MTKPTIGQLEREIVNHVRSFYNKELGHNPGQIICHFFDTQMVISIANSVTQVEATLTNGDYQHLAEVVRHCIDKIMQPHLQAIIEELIGYSVVDLMSHTSLITGTTGILAILKESPDVRNPEAIPKLKRKSLPTPESG
jgi:uncharacterized protein YbcI